MTADQYLTNGRDLALAQAAEFARMGDEFLLDGFHEMADVAFEDREERLLDAYAIQEEMEYGQSPDALYA
jgi:hypothetical protein